MEMNFLTAADRWIWAFTAKIFSKPPVLGEEAIGQAGKGGAIGNEVLFHVGRMPMAFADYVQAMRRYSGFWSEPSRLHRDAFGRMHVLRQIILKRAFHKWRWRA
jgi:hypothetical protein